MKKVIIALTVAVFTVLMLSSGVKFIEGAEVMDKDKMTEEGLMMI